MQTTVAGRTDPPIILIDSEADSLFGLACAASGQSQMAADLLLQELGRAETSDRDGLPNDVVTMMSHVRFVDEETGAEHNVQLVYPKFADSEQQRISILTPIGAALIGMRTGSTIDWPTRSGACRPLKIVEVKQPPVNT